MMSTTLLIFNGAWVTNYTSIVGLATALRINLIQVATTKLASEGKNSKMEILYNYLSGSEFRQKVEAIAEAFVSMKKDLDQEKRAMMRIWAKRDKQIERVINNTATMYGDMQGIIGASMPQIESLELKALPAGTNFGEFKDDGKEDEIFEPKNPDDKSMDEQIDTQLIKEISRKNNEETSKLIEDLDDDELKIYNCLKEDFSGNAENGDIAIKLRIGSTLVANRFNRLKSKGLVTEIREVEGGIKWKIVH